MKFKIKTKNKTNTSYSMSDGELSPISEMILSTDKGDKQLAQEILSNIEITDDQVDLIYNMLQSVDRNDQELAKGIMENSKVNSNYNRIIDKLLKTPNWRLVGSTLHNESSDKETYDFEIEEIINKYKI